LTDILNECDGAATDLIFQCKHNIGNYSWTLLSVVQILGFYRIEFDSR
jgi:hypothetical protein